MKKMISLILAVLMVVCAVSALAETATEIPTVVPAEKLEDFVGVWNLYGAAFAGSYFPKEALGDMEAVVTITDKDATLDYSGMAYTSPCALNALDGTLTVTDADGTVTVFYMNDNGTISLTTETTNGEITMYFAKAEEEK